MSFTHRFRLIIFSLIVFACNQSKPVSSGEKNRVAYFIVGSGGGFTGLYTQYKVNNTGLIENYDFENKIYKVYLKVKPSQVKPFFARIEALNLKDYSYNNPGNITDYLIVLLDDGKPNRIVWSNASSNIKPEINTLFKEVNRFIKSQKLN